MKNNVFKKIISAVLSICCIVSSFAFTNSNVLAATNARNKAYGKVVSSLVNQYGKAKYDDYNGTILGVNCVELIDFNNDGKDELLVTYTDVKNSEFPSLYYRIYAYINKKAKCVKKGLYGTGGEIGDRGGVFLEYTNKGVLLVTQKFVFDMEKNIDDYFIITYSFNGKKFKQKDKLSSQDHSADYEAEPVRKLNGKKISEKEFMKQKNKGRL